MAKRSSAITRAHLDSDLLIKTIVRGNGRCVRDCPSSGFSRTLCGVIGSEFGLGAMVVLAGTQSRGSASHGVRIRPWVANEICLNFHLQKPCALPFRSPSEAFIPSKLDRNSTRLNSSHLGI